MSGLGLILAERERQRERFSAEHDLEHGATVLYRAAQAYEITGDGGDADAARAHLWPFEPDAFKPRDKVADLTRSGALLIACMEVAAARKPGALALSMPSQWALTNDLVKVARRLTVAVADAATPTPHDSPLHERVAGLVRDLSQRRYKGLPIQVGFLDWLPDMIRTNGPEGLVAAADGLEFLATRLRVAAQDVEAEHEAALYGIHSMIEAIAREAQS